MQGLDGCAGEAVILTEQPLQDFLVLESAVVQHGDETGQPLDRLAGLVEEEFGNTEDAVASDGDQLLIAQKLLHTGDGHTEVLRDVHQLEERDGRVQDIVTVRDGTHSPNVIWSLPAWRYRSVSLATIEGRVAGLRALTGERTLCTMEVNV